MDLSTIATAFLVAWSMLVAPSGTQAFQRSDQPPQLRQPNSGRFRIEGNLVAAPRQATLRGDGAFALPDRLQLAMEAAADGQRERFELVVVGQTAYARSGRNGRWDVQDVRGAESIPFPREGRSPATSDPRIAEALGSLRPIAIEPLQGIQTERYHGDLDILALAETFAPGDRTLRDELQSFSMSLDLWVGVSDRYLHQLRLGLEARARRARPGTPDSLTADLLIAFSDFDQPISIAAPVGQPPTAAPAPAQVPAQAPARAPTRLPDTGQSPTGAVVLPLLGWLLVFVGVGLRRRAVR